jgi:hypothetical protein
MFVILIKKGMGFMVDNRLVQPSIDLFYSTMSSWFSDCCMKYYKFLTVFDCLSLWYVLGTTLNLLQSI